MNHDVSRIKSYWFDSPEPVKKWFMGGPETDEEIRTQFGSLVDQARKSELDSWKEKPQSTLALVLLLDQFPRNIFRGSPLSYSSDAMALNVTTEAIAKGFDREVPHLQQSFFYLPLMHDEKLITQVAGMAMFELLSKRCDPESAADKFSKESWHFAERHRDVILKFGRFPSRNEILGRDSTEEEIAYLREHPSGF